MNCAVIYATSLSPCSISTRQNRLFFVDTATPVCGNLVFDKVFPRASKNPVERSVTPLGNANLPRTQDHSTAQCGLYAELVFLVMFALSSALELRAPEPLIACILNRGKVPGI